MLQQRRFFGRREQGSNLRGKFPLDFKSNALTTRPSQRNVHSERRKTNTGIQPKQKAT